MTKTFPAKFPVEKADDNEFAPAAAVDRPEQAASFLIVWRDPRGILHRTLGPAEYACLNAASRSGGTTLPELAQVILEADGGEAGSNQDADPESPGVQKATRHLTELMGRWLADGILQGAPDQP